MGNTYGHQIQATSKYWILSPWLLDTHLCLFWKPFFGGEKGMADLKMLCPHYSQLPLFLPEQFFLLQTVMLAIESSCSPLLLTEMLFLTFWQ